MSKWQVFPFATAALVLTVGSLEQLFGFDSHPLVACLLSLPFLLQTCSKEDRLFGRHPSPLTKFCIGFGITLLVCEHLPKSISLPVQHVIHHPVLVASVWLFLLWRLLLRWRSEKALADV